jgi:hypothetical protein
MSIEAMKQALDAITNVLAGGDFDNPYADLKQAGAVLKQAIEQAENQEPVAWVCYGAPGKRDIDFEEADINGLPIGTNLYTTPPVAQRTWVGLTDEEIKVLSSWWPSYEQMPALMTLARDIENSLKEKNVSQP